jgi:hypothetical protein
MQGMDILANSTPGQYMYIATIFVFISPSSPTYSAAKWVRSTLYTMYCIWEFLTPSYGILTQIIIRLCFIPSFKKNKKNKKAKITLHFPNKSNGLHTVYGRDAYKGANPLHNWHPRLCSAHRHKRATLSARGGGVLEDVGRPLQPSFCTQSDYRPRLWVKRG